jgi:hypothetical protein
MRMTREYPSGIKQIQLLKGHASYRNIGDFIGIGWWGHPILNSRQVLIPPRLVAYTVSMETKQKEMYHSAPIVMSLIGQGWGT